MTSTAWRAVTGMAGLAIATTLLAGCSGDGQTPHQAELSASPVTAAPTVRGTRIDITIGRRSVQPSGARVRVRVGSPVTLVIRADAAGELHVHSSPEQHLAYPAGTSMAVLRLPRPGIVDVESHHLDTLVAQLEVR